MCRVQYFFSFFFWVEMHHWILRFHRPNQVSKRRMLGAGPYIVVCLGVLSVSFVVFFLLKCYKRVRAPRGESIFYHETTQAAFEGPTLVAQTIPNEITPSNEFGFGCLTGGISGSSSGSALGSSKQTKRPRPYQRKSKGQGLESAQAGQRKKKNAGMKDRFKVKQVRKESVDIVRDDEKKLDFSLHTCPKDPGHNDQNDHNDHNLRAENDEKALSHQLFHQSSSSAPSVLSSISSWFDRIIPHTQVTPQSISHVIREIELHLITRNVPLTVVEELTLRCQDALRNKSLPIWSSLISCVRQAIRDELQNKVSIFPEALLLQKILERKSQAIPFTIAVCGVNGIGKSTSLAKMAFRLSQQCQQVQQGNRGVKVAMAACDTFRSGAIEQLRVHSKLLKIPLFEQPYGRDPASVGFEARVHFREMADVVLLDTAGRMQNNTNLMKSLTRFIHIVKPDLVIFVGEATAGNDLLDQVTEFQKAIIDGDKENGIDALCLTKTDIAGNQIGSILAVPYLTRRPILYLGTGQRYTDLETGNIPKIVDLLFA